MGLATLAAMLFAVDSAKANVILNVGLTDPNALGDVVSGITAGGQVNRDVLMVNQLLALGLGATQTIDGHQYQRSLNVFSPLPAAITTDAMLFSIPGGYTGFTGDWLELTLADTFRYLVVKYDGPNSGTQVWDVASFDSGTILQLPRYAQPTSPGSGPLVPGKYEMSGWTLLNVGKTPDGGSTIVLLGLAIFGVDFLRRRTAKA